jgi:hypothetical protein
MPRLVEVPHQPAEVVTQLTKILHEGHLAVLAGISLDAARDFIPKWRKHASMAPRILSRFRNAPEVVTYVAEREGNATTAAWFTGVQEEIGNRSPILHIRDGGSMEDLRVAAINTVGEG